MVKRKKQSVGALIGAFILPIMFVVAWASALLSTSSAPGALMGEPTNVLYLRWIVYYTGIVLLISSAMHSAFAKSTAASIGWKTNGFQYELSFFSLGAGLAALYATYHSIDALVTISIAVSVFLLLAGANHVKEIVKEKNYAPNNTLILVWDFGIAASLAVLAYAVT